MARGNDRDRGNKRVQKERDNRRGAKKKFCVFCKDKSDWVDYKDVNLLRRFMSDRGKIRSRRVSGNCAQHQREVAVAIKTARELALLPYTQRTVTERAGGRGGGRGGGRDRAPAPEVEAEVEPVEALDGDGGDSADAGLDEVLADVDTVDPAEAAGDGNEPLRPPADELSAVDAGSGEEA
ncbi:MAG: small subunit ribosomal protein [Acidimicrobiaceae bacterium]|jgi:small subunit ribosomal protein S18|nr:small subunit ribosomal protein [Acidimicrobiaceae bacterium]